MNGTRLNIPSLESIDETPMLNIEIATNRPQRQQDQHRFGCGKAKGDWTMKRQGMLVVAVTVMLLCPLGCRGLAGGGMTLTGPELLEGPDLPGATVAKSPPTVDVWLLDSLPEQDNAVWSSLADGCLASNGKFYAGVANSREFASGQGDGFILEYDPADASVRPVARLREAIGNEHIAAGKLHSPIDQGSDGWLYFTTYWGENPTDADWDAGFLGSAVMRLNPATGKLELLGVPVHGQGLPACRLDPKRMILYALAVPSNDFLAYDVRSREVLYRGSGAIQKGSRNILLDADGNAYFTTRRGHLARYSPLTNSVAVTPATLPSRPDGSPGSLRASTKPSPAGVIYGATWAGVLFAFDPAWMTVRELGPNIGEGEYAPAMAVSHDGRFLYYAFSPMRDFGRHGAPVVQYDLATGKRTVLAFLNPIMRRRLDYFPAGTFNLRIGPDDATLYMTFNGARPAADGQEQKPMGLPAIIVLHIPPELRASAAQAAP